jgi:hypothetical protein
MIIFELYGLMDCAVDLAQYYATTLAERIDVEQAIERLIYRPTQTRHTGDVVECMRMIGDLRARIAELIGTINADQDRITQLTGTIHAHQDRITQLEDSLDSTKVLAARLGRKLTAAPALLWRRIRPP